MKGVTTNKVNAIKKDKGINFGIIPNRFKSENFKYIPVEYPFSIIRSKKLTARTVSAIRDKPNKIKKNVLNISIKKF